MSTEPPFYILCSSSPISATVPGAPSTTLGHPTIQYQYADDSPFVLLPQTQDEQVLVLDWDPNTAPASAPTVRSISRNVAVTAVRVAEAPGAAAEDEVRNDRMYILETTTAFDDKCVSRPSVCPESPSLIDDQSGGGRSRVVDPPVTPGHSCSVQTEVSTRSCPSTTSLRFVLKKRRLTMCTRPGCVVITLYMSSTRCIQRQHCELAPLALAASIFITERLR